MPPRFMERMQRQSETLAQLYGLPQFDPPPYDRSSTLTASTVTTTSDTRSSFSEASTSPSSVISPDSGLPSYEQATQRLTSRQTPCIPRGALILVTAANSCHGMHIVDKLLQEGYRVRGAVRNADRAQQTTEHFLNKYGGDRFNAVIMPDMAVPGAYQSAVRGCYGIIHAADRAPSWFTVTTSPTTVMMT